ncbi:hypothetical protein TNCV_992851 [Trichonephila clavipes]|nr:hypothetical protein TNCV_992851 [Trichonephila clavipes]
MHEKISLLGISKIQKTPAEKVPVSSDCPTQYYRSNSLHVFTASIMAVKDILEFVQSSKNTIDAGSDEENEMNNAAPLLASHPKEGTS